MQNATAPFKVDLKVICTIDGEEYNVGYAKEALNTTYKIRGKYDPDISSNTKLD